MAAWIGAAPVVAEVASSMDALVTLCYTPFTFEGARKRI